MGVQLNPLACKQSIMMKSVAVAALCFFAAVAAEADADADAYYAHGYGYGHHLGHHSAHALVVSTVHGGPLHGLTSVYGGLYGHYYGKRSADAEPTAAAAPEADADAYYHHGYAHYGHGLLHHGYGYGLAHHGYGYYGHPYLHHGYYGYHH